MPQREGARAGVVHGTRRRALPSRELKLTMQHAKIDLSDQAAWDDTALIEAYDRAIRSYQARALSLALFSPCSR